MVFLRAETELSRPWVKPDKEKYGGSDMRTMKINREWDFGPGQVDLGKRREGIFGDRKVNLPHEYMI